MRGKNEGVTPVSAGREEAPLETFVSRRSIGSSKDSKLHISVILTE